MKNLFCILCFLMCISSLHAHSIVFVHLGPSLPNHLSTTIAQARLFNLKCPIYLIANRICLDESSSLMKTQNVTPVACESLIRSTAHHKFSHGNKRWRGGAFWIYTSERFFYLEEFVRQNELHDVFHLENDMMLYVDLEELLPIFRKYYRNMIAATFENDERVVPGFMYISSPRPLSYLVESFPKRIAIDQTDMESVANFKKSHYKVMIDHLPIVVPEYALDRSLSSHLSGVSKDPQSFSNHVEKFDSIFDAAAWGIYLAGWDSAFHAACYPGEITPYCIFNPSFFQFHWEIDGIGRRIPFVSYRGKSIRINNLHITNKKRITDFLSLTH